MLFRSKEPFAEWYGVVKRAVHDVVRADVVKPLDEREHYAEQRPEQQQLDMPELVGIYFAQSKIPIIHLFRGDLALLLYIYIGARFGIMVETVFASRNASAMLNFAPHPLAPLLRGAGSFAAEGLNKTY